MSGLRAGQFDGGDDAPVRLRPQVILERLLGFPALEQHDGGFRSLLVEDVAGGATRLGPHGPLDGPQDLEHGSVSVRESAGSSPFR